jgi:rhamnosyltransferase
MTRASLVIPTLNAGPLLDEVLDAVDRQPGAQALERVAIDSGSADGTQERLRRHGFRVLGIDKREFNHGTTRDCAIDETRGDVIVLLTQDATPADERWLASLLACYDDELVGAAYCRQIPRPDCNPFIARRLQEWTAGKTERVVQRVDSAEAFAALPPMERLRVSAYDNVAGSVRRSAWQRHRFGHRAFGEDVAFGKRLVLDGHHIVFEPDSAVVHSHNRTPRAEGKRIYCDHQNLRELFDLHLLPTWKSYREAVRWGEKTYAGVVDSLGLEPTQRAEMHAWARGYARWAALGMYLGANSARNMRGPFGPLFRWIDRWMHAGI